MHRETISRGGVAGHRGLDRRDTADWTVHTLPVAEIADVPVGAEYDGTTGEVRFLADRVGGTSAGHAARRYIGRTTYVDLD